MKDLAKSKLSEAGEQVIDILKDEVIQVAHDGIARIMGKNGEESEAQVDSVKSEKLAHSLNSKPVINESMSSEEEDNFIDSISTNLMSAGISAIANRDDAMGAIKSLIETAGEVAKFQEVQITKRTEIERKRQTALKVIETQKALLMQYLEKTFDERKELFKQHFKVVDDALQKGNINQLSIGLSCINELAMSSPFRDLSSIEEVGKALADKNKVWDF